MVFDLCVLRERSAEQMCKADVLIKLDWEGERIGLVFDLAVDELQTTRVCDDSLSGPCFIKITGVERQNSAAFGLDANGIFFR